MKTAERHKQYMREVWYPRNKQKQIDLVKANKLKLKEEIDGLKNAPCMDCGVKYPSYIMEFHHLGNKLGNVATLMKEGKRNKVYIEIAKCVLLCANCHRERTYGK